MCTAVDRDCKHLCTAIARDCKYLSSAVARNCKICVRLQLEIARSVCGCSQGLQNLCAAVARDCKICVLLQLGIANICVVLQLGIARFVYGCSQKLQDLCTAVARDCKICVLLQLGIAKSVYCCSQGLQRSVECCSQKWQDVYCCSQGLQNPCTAVARDCKYLCSVAARKCNFPFFSSNSAHSSSLYLSQYPQYCPLISATGAFCVVSATVFLYVFNLLVLEVKIFHSFLGNFYISSDAIHFHWLMTFTNCFFFLYKHFLLLPFCTNVTFLTGSSFAQPISQYHIILTSSPTRQSHEDIARRKKPLRFCSGPIFQARVMTESLYHTTGTSHRTDYVRNCRYKCCLASRSSVYRPVQDVCV